MTIFYNLDEKYVEGFRTEFQAGTCYCRSLGHQSRECPVGNLSLQIIQIQVGIFSLHVINSQEIPQV